MDSVRVLAKGKFHSPNRLKKRGHSSPFINKLTAVPFLLQSYVFNLQHEEA
jgi:hypothetical protein